MVTGILQFIRRKSTKPKDVYIELQGDLLYGIQPVVMALAASRRQIHRIFYNKGSLRALEIVKTVEARRIPCTQLSRYQLDELSRKAAKYKDHHVHQGVVADVSRLYHLPVDYRMPQIDTPPWEDEYLGDNQRVGSNETAIQANQSVGSNETAIQANQRVGSNETAETSTENPVEGRRRLRLLLCGVKDPMNLGAILRTSLFLGVERLIVTGERCDLSSVVSKASSGALEMLPVYSVRHGAEFVTSQSRLGWRVLALSLPSPHLPHSATVQQACADPRPTLLVVGSEGGGIPPAILAAAHTGVYIPPGFKHHAIDPVNGSRDHVTGSGDNLTGSEDHMTGSEDNVIGSRNHLTGSGDHVTGSRDFVAGSRNHVAGSELYLDSLNVSVATGIILHSLFTR